MKAITIKGSVRVIEGGEPQDGHDFEFTERCGWYAHRKVFVNSTTMNSYMPEGMNTWRLIVLNPERPIKCSLSSPGTHYFIARGPTIIRAKKPWSSAFYIANIDDYSEGNEVEIWYAGDPTMPVA